MYSNKINFLVLNSLGTTFTGAQVVLWPGGTLYSLTDWCGSGIKAGKILYNAPINAKHSFQINGTEYAYINSNGIVTGNV